MKGGITIDILFLVDRLEELFHHGSRLPFSHKRIVEEQAFLDIIDQMRIMIPEEIRQAKRIIEERERILAQAQEDAERTRTLAQQQAAMLLSQEGRVQMAEDRAEQIIAEARAHAEQLKADADRHCISVLAELEREMNSILATTHNGIQHLQTRMATLQGNVSEPGEKR